MGGERSRFSCKKSRVVHTGETAYRRGGKHCFSLISYGFCQGNALYSASLSFRMFIFLLILEIVTISD